MVYLRTPITFGLSALTAGLTYRGLGPENLGHFAALLALLAPANIIASIYSIVNQRIFSQDILTGELGVSLDAKLSAVWRVAPLSVPLGAAGIYWLSPSLEQTSAFIACLALTISAHLLVTSSLSRAALEATEQFGALQRVAVGEALLRLFSAGLIFLFEQWRLNLFILLYCLTFLAVHLQLKSLAQTHSRREDLSRPANETRPSPSIICDSRRHLRQVAVQQTAWQISASGSVLAIERIHGPTLAGAWSLASQLGGYIASVSAAVVSAARPAITNVDLSKSSGTPTTSLANWTNSITGSLVTLICVPVTVFADEVLHLFSGSTSAQLKYCLWCFVAQSLCRSLTSGWSALLNARANLAAINFIELVQSGALVTFLLVSGNLIDAQPYALILVCAIFLVGLLARGAYSARLIKTSFTRWLLQDAGLSLGVVALLPALSVVCEVNLQNRLLLSALSCTLFLVRLAFLIRRRPLI